MLPDGSKSGKPGTRFVRGAASLVSRLSLRAVRLPERCLTCGAATEDSLCDECFRELPWNDHPCRRCAAPVPGLLTGACGQCARHPPAYDAAYAAFVYAWPLDRLLQDFKFRGRLATGRVLALALAEYLELKSAPRPDLLVPVPLHRRRLSQRGFNQAAELALVLGRRLALPGATGLLRRTRRTPPQSGLGRAARRRNLRQAFECRRTVAGLHVALVDDVVTTGSTVEAATRILKKAGARRVSVYAVARA